MPILPPLWTPFHGAIALEHIEKAVGAVECSVFGGELIVDIGVGLGVKGIDVWLVDCRPWKTDERTGPEGYHWVGGC